jgi:shikimate kinase
MEFQGTAYSAGTIINAIATGKGCAFGIDLKTRVVFTPSEEMKVIDGGKTIKSEVVKRIFRVTKVRGKLEIESNIPRKSGLGSSSAFVNSILLSVFKYKNEELDPLKILRLNAEISLQSRISYTGAFDDASASLLGGIVITDNKEMRILRRKEINQEVLILIPDHPKKKVNVSRVRKNPELIEKAFEFALSENYMNAMYYNTIYYCEKIGYSPKPVMDARELGLSAGLSGNGPTYVAFGSKKEIEELETIWERYGKTLKSRTISKPCEESFNEYIKKVIEPDVVE